MELKEKLTAAVRTRVENQPSFSNLGVLFSGGLDSVVLTALADQVGSCIVLGDICRMIKHCFQILPADKSIDLMNVAFESPSSPDFDVPDRKTAKRALAELQAINPKRKYSLVKVRS